MGLSPTQQASQDLYFIGLRVDSLLSGDLVNENGELIDDTGAVIPDDDAAPPDEEVAPILDETGKPIPDDAVVIDNGDGTFEDGLGEPCQHESEEMHG